MKLVASIAGAQILVNTIGYVQGTLKLGSQQYGWVMAAFGIGATLSALAFSAVDPTESILSDYFKATP